MASSQEFGLTQITFDGPQGDLVGLDHEPIDIVAIHGLDTGSPLTWVHGYGDQSVHWLRDLLPNDLPCARIFTYDWNARSFNLESPEQFLHDHAEELLFCLSQARETVENSRQVIFVASCFGGLLLAQALLIASTRSNSWRRLVYDAVAGILFLGTPFKGSDAFATKAAVIRAYVYQAMTGNGSVTLLHQLSSTVGSLDGLVQSFARLHLPMKFFYETETTEVARAIVPRSLLSVPIMQTFSETVKIVLVPKASATIDGFDHIALNVKHAMLNKFPSSEDANYRRVLYTIRAFVQIAQTRATVVKSLKEVDLSKWKESLLSSLDFAEMFDRQKHIDDPCFNTCEWIYQTKQYDEWLHPETLHNRRDFLWVKGKAGSGKSTVMKALLRHTSSLSLTVISFFFNARGQNSEFLEKSTMGLYRSLLHQLLASVDEAEVRRLLLHFPELENLAPHQFADFKWSVNFLKGLIESTVRRLNASPVTVLIDALDECDEVQVRDMVGFLRQLTKRVVAVGIELRICFASRPYPRISVSEILEINLEQQDGHHRDIQIYINENLAIGQSWLADDIRGKVHKRANGLFLWVKLVVAELKKSFDKGRLHDLPELLHSLPSGINELLKDILSRDNDNLNELILVLQWVVHANEPLTLGAIFWALHSGLDLDKATNQPPEQYESSTMARFIVACSKGLLEVLPTANRMDYNNRYHEYVLYNHIPDGTFDTVQVIHESVGEFLRDSTKAEAMLPSTITSKVHSRPHDQLKQCCNNYFLRHIKQMKVAGLYRSQPDYLPDFWEVEPITSMVEFHDYALRNVLFHSDDAEGSGESQNDFIATFPFSDWSRLRKDQGAARHSFNSRSQLHIFARLNLLNLITKHRERTLYWDADESQNTLFRTRTPLLTALSSGCWAVASYFLDLEMEAKRPEHCHLQEYFHSDKTEYRWALDDSHVNWSLARYNRHLFLYFLKSGQLDINQQDENGSNLMIRLIQFSRPPHSYQERVEEWLGTFLISAVSFDLNAPDKKGRTALHHAVQASGQVGYIKLLLESQRVDPNTRDKLGRTPLHLAAESAGTGDCSERLLLRHPLVDPVAQDNDGMTPLHIRAVRAWTAGLVKDLLRHPRMNIHIRNKNGQTALELALWSGRERELLNSYRRARNRLFRYGPGVIMVADLKVEDTVKDDRK